MSLYSVLVSLSATSLLDPPLYAAGLKPLLALTRLTSLLCHFLLSLLPLVTSCEIAQILSSGSAHEGLVHLRVCMHLGPASALLSASNCLIIAVAALANRLSINFVPVPAILFWILKLSRRSFQLHPRFKYSRKPWQCFLRRPRHTDIFQLRTHILRA